MNLGIGRLWAGTEDSLQAILEMEASLTPERVAELRKAAFAEDDEGSARQPRLLHKQPMGILGQDRVNPSHFVSHKSLLMAT